MPRSTHRDTRTDRRAEAGSAPGAIPTGWTAYVIFAGVLLAVAGLIHAMAGVTALVDSDSLDARAEALVVNLDFDVWGWVHLVLGVVAMVTAFLLLRGDRAGRLLAIAVCGVGAVVNLVFLPAAPSWSLVAIAFDVLVIYAVTVHGDALPSDR